MTIPGIREGGDRTVEEQMIGLDRGLAEAKGKTVLDLGCAEAAIARAFALAGASDVLGMEILEEHLRVARLLCADVPQVRLVQADLNKHLPKDIDERFDIVLALAIIHKLRSPETGLRFAACSSKSLLIIRLPVWAKSGVVRYKYGEMKYTRCDVHAVMRSEGFHLEHEVMGPRSEPAEYWRRT